MGVQLMTGWSPGCGLIVDPGTVLSVAGAELRCDGSGYAVPAGQTCATFQPWTTLARGPIVTTFAETGYHCYKRIGWYVAVGVTNGASTEFGYNSPVWSATTPRNSGSTPPVSSGETFDAFNDVLVEGVMLWWNGVQRTYHLPIAQRRQYSLRQLVNARTELPGLIESPTPQDPSLPNADGVLLHPDDDSLPSNSFDLLSYKELRESSNDQVVECAVGLDMQRAVGDATTLNTTRVRIGLVLDNVAGCSNPGSHLGIGSLLKLSLIHI